MCILLAMTLRELLRRLQEEVPDLDAVVCVDDPDAWCAKPVEDIRQYDHPERGLMVIIS